MCLSIPSKVVSIDEDKQMCTVDTMGVSRDASLAMMAEGDVKIGDFVLIHIGFVMNKISAEEAEASLETYREIIAMMDEEELRRTIEEDDSCVDRT
ncbi:MAG: HypC/HybG/HupF family hydrogenase formation chaperone [Sulfurovaceae bacterium]|nr:HypC/HybG/HupF family hydrogenase formation chaperone [Sulfurovaceae bacterium]